MMSAIDELATNDLVATGEGGEEKRIVQIPEEVVGIQRNESQTLSTVPTLKQALMVHMDDAAMILRTNIYVIWGLVITFIILWLLTNDGLVIHYFYGDNAIVQFARKFNRPIWILFLSIFAPVFVLIGRADAISQRNLKTAVKLAGK